MGRVLIAAADVRRAATSALRRQGFLVVNSGLGADFVPTLTASDPHLVILEQPPTELVQLTRRHSRAAILIVTDSNCAAIDRRGVDDCLRRPFAMVHLIARVRALLRRHRRGDADRHVVVGDYLISPTGEARHSEYPIALTGTEQRVLAFLATHRGVIVSKPDLLAAVWGSAEGAPNVVEVNISTLRRKLERHGPRIVHTVRGLGYRLGVG